MPVLLHDYKPERYQPDEPLTVWRGILNALALGAFLWLVLLLLVGP